MAKEYIEREAVKRELLSWAVSLNHPEYLIKDDALHIIDSIPAADVVEQEQESKLLNGWISVQDRLPETDGIYIVCDCRLNGNQWIHTDGFRKASSSWCELHGMYYDDVYGRYSEQDKFTHWMPMPEPPEM